MKMILFARTQSLLANPLVKIVLPMLIILACQNICFGQVYSYTSLTISGSDVVAYTDGSSSYNSSTHVYSINGTITSPSGRTASYSSSGSSATGYLGIQSEEGTFYAIANIYGSCPYSGYAHTLGVPSGQVTTCVDTCTVCRASRLPKEIACAAASATCEANFLAQYNSEMTACENNNFCNPSHPQYNQQQCDNCKTTAEQNLALRTVGCTSAYIGCRALITPDCEVPTIKKADCSTCSNFPFF